MALLSLREDDEHQSAVWLNPRWDGWEELAREFLESWLQIHDSKKPYSREALKGKSYK